MVKDLCFEIIDKCPNECSFCSSNSCYEKNTTISFNDFKKVIDYFISEGGIEELSLSGGEPFLHPDIFNIIEYSKKYGIRTVVFTSGIKKKNLVNPNLKKYYIQEMNKRIKEIEINEPWNVRLKTKIINFYKNIINSPQFSSISKEELIKLKEVGFDKIVFDFQAYEHKTDELLMGRNRNKHICFLDSMLNASFVGIETDVHFIPMEPNYKEIGDILELLEIANIKNISILKFVPQGRGIINASDLMLSENKINEFMNLLKYYNQFYSGNVRIGIPLQGESSHKCNAGLEKLNIKFDGTVVPCPAFKEIDLETMNKFKIKYYNIYKNLEEKRLQEGRELNLYAKRCTKDKRHC